MALLLIEIWHGDPQRVGHLGGAQADFNVVGHLENGNAVDQLFWSLNGGAETAMTFQAFRRLVDDGDFNADIPIELLRVGANQISIRAKLLDGEVIFRTVTVIRKEGECSLPVDVDWSLVDHPQDVGQIVDGRWEVTAQGLRTDQLGYDRLFLIGERDWRDYEIETSFIIHEVSETTGALSGGNGLGIVWRFAGHVVGGYRGFPEAQPKWGYQPFGAIGWLRWPKDRSRPPMLQFYPGSHDHSVDYGSFPSELEVVYGLRLRCETLPDAEDGAGVTRYSFKIWKKEMPEPDRWSWTHLQEDAHALRMGGFALVAHHVDATFGNIRVLSLHGD